MAEPALKKYRGKGGSETSTVEATLIESPCSSFIGYDWDSIFQICAIKVLKLGEEKSGQIYGTITLHHKWGKWKLYHGQKGNTEPTIIPGDMAVKHPIFGITPFDPLLITFELEGEFEGANKITLAWMPLDPRDQIMTYTLSGGACSMQVSFIAFKRAVLADIEIYLLNDNMDGESEEEQGIYGSIYASFSEMHSAVPFLMFEKRESIDSVLVKMGEAVPLLRPCIAVPKKNDLQIHVHLNTFSGDPIAGGIIKVSPKKGTWEGVLGKEHGHTLQVVAKVHLSGIEEHLPTIKVCEDWA